MSDIINYEAQNISSQFHWDTVEDFTLTFSADVYADFDNRILNYIFQKYNILETNKVKILRP